jgi:hypothetical protein
MTPQEFGRGCDALTHFVGWTVATFALAVVGWFFVKNIWLLFYHARHGDQRWRSHGRALLETSWVMLIFLAALDVVDANAAREPEEYE